MFEIRKTTITHMRGDTAAFKVNLTCWGEPYEIKEDDILKLTIKKSATSDDIVLQKEITGKDTFFFNHEDTENLTPGNYVWDIQYRNGFGVVQTIGPGKYVLKRDITRGV